MSNKSANVTTSSFCVVEMCIELAGFVIVHTYIQHLSGVVEDSVSGDVKKVGCKNTTLTGT